MPQRPSSKILACITPEIHVIPTCTHRLPLHMRHALAHEKESLPMCEGCQPNICSFMRQGVKQAKESAVKRR